QQAGPVEVEPVRRRPRVLSANHGLHTAVVELRVAAALVRRLLARMGDQLVPVGPRDPHARQASALVSRPSSYDDATRSSWRWRAQPAAPRPWSSPAAAARAARRWPPPPARTRPRR